MPTEMTRRLYQSPGDDCLTPILDAVKSANTSIRAVCYAFVWPDLAAMLIARHQSGVDVRLVMDKLQAAGHSEHPEVVLMQTAGVPLVIRNSERSHIVHDKILVIDGATVIRGSFNLTLTAELEDNEVEIDTGNPVWGAAFAAEFDRLWQTAPPPAPLAP